LIIESTGTPATNDLFDSTEEMVGEEFCRLLLQIPFELRLAATQMLVVNALAYINEACGENIATTTVSAAMEALKLSAAKSQSL